MDVSIGCAGWAIPRARAGDFPGEGSHLERYARVLPAVEINSTFHRPHRRATYERWAASVPESFRFSLKVPKEITHVRRLRDAGAALGDFLAASAGLGRKRGPLLVQLPPGLAFEPACRGFFETLRGVFDEGVACEPRHPGWFTEDVDRTLADLRVARVAADPAPAGAAAGPGGWDGLVYHRRHGSPKIYRSSYGRDALEALAGAVQGRLREGASVWCIFDNTAAGAAAGNALELKSLLGGK